MGSQRVGYDWVTELNWGIFPTQGSNPYLLHLLHWQEDSILLSDLRSSDILYIWLIHFAVQQKLTQHCKATCSVTKSCPPLYNPKDCSTLGFPALHYLPEFAETHVHWVGEAIQPSYPLSSPSPPAFSLSQHQGLFHESVLHIRWPKYGTSASASVLPTNIQNWFPLGLTTLISLLSKGLSRVFSSTTIWRHQFFHIQAFLLSSSHIHTWLLENHSFDYMDLCRQSNVSAF